MEIWEKSKSTGSTTFVVKTTNSGVNLNYIQLFFRVFRWDLLPILQFWKVELPKWEKEIIRKNNIILGHRKS